MAFADEVRPFGVRPIVDELFFAEIERLKQRYGQDGEHPLAYHNQNHTLDVVYRTIAIMRRIRILPQAAECVLLGALYHDHEQLLGPVLNEQASADYARLVIAETGEFTGRQINIVDGTIHGTVNHRWRGRLMQHARSPLEYIVADANMGSLGSPWPEAWNGVRNFFQELEPEAELTFAAMRSYLVDGTLPLFEQHRFHSRAANAAMPHRKTNVIQLRNVIRTETLPEDLAA